MTDFNFYATYKDGTRQMLTDTFSYDHLKHADIVSFTARIGPKQELFTIHLQPDQHLIYRHRGLAQVGNPTPEQLAKLEVEPNIWLMGWRQNIKGTSIQSITYIVDYPNNLGFQLHQAGAWNNDHPWFYKPSFRKFEVDVGEEYWDDYKKVWVVKVPE